MNAINSLRPAALLAVQLLCCLALPASVGAQPFTDPTMLWQAAPGDAPMATWQFVANPRSLPAEFLPVPASTSPSRSVVPARPSSP